MGFGFLLWIVLDNQFMPVMVYGILAMVCISLSLFLIHYRQNQMVGKFMSAGILISVLAALIFAFIKNTLFLKPSDISHVLMALSLIVLSSGIYRMEFIDYKSENA